MPPLMAPPQNVLINKWAMKILGSGRLEEQIISIFGCVFYCIFPLTTQKKKQDRRNTLETYDNLKTIT